jgi:shikimate dehydrogenase
MKLYGLIGYPLGHSFSKQYFTEKFHEEGLTDCSFEAFPIPSINEFPSLLKANPELLGLGVTIPYKELVLPYLDELSGEVAAIGATNSIKISNGKLTGFNTDIIGFEQSFSKFLKPHHTRALVLGAGGASKAVQYVLRKLKIDYVVVTRSPRPGTGSISYREIDATTISLHPVIINCTPLGMFPNVTTSPEIPYQYLTPDHYLFDLVYKPGKTVFLEKGEVAGAATQNGYEMLILQAEASWKIWNDL